MEKTEYDVLPGNDDVLLSQGFVTGRVRASEKVGRFTDEYIRRGGRPRRFFNGRPRPDNFGTPDRFVRACRCNNAATAVGRAHK